MQRLIWVLWPSFLVAAAGNAVLFTLLDPVDLPLLGADALEVSRTAAYSIGFFAMWAFAAASSALTCLLHKSAFEINRFCPLDATDRPGGCPKREEPVAATGVARDVDILGIGVGGAG